MNVLKTLGQFVAPELNHIYTVAPHMIDGYLDCGWSCREHAFHTAALGQVLGFRCQICLGEFVVHSPDVPLTSSGGNGDAHVWCQVNDISPVDLSMTFKLYGPGPQLDAPVMGTGRNGDYLVTLRNIADKKTRRPKHPHVIVFFEFSRRSVDVGEIFSNPYSFLFAPREGDESSWDVLFGPTIYEKISLHCLRITQGRTAPLRSRMDPYAAIRWISENYRVGEFLMEMTKVNLR